MGEWPLVLRRAIVVAAGLVLGACSMTQSTLIDAGGEFAPEAVGRNAGRGRLVRTGLHHEGPRAAPSPIRCQERSRRGNAQTWCRSIVG